MRILTILAFMLLSLHSMAQKEFRKTRTMLGVELGPMLTLTSQTGLPAFVPTSNANRFFFAPTFSYFLKNNLGFTVALQVIPEEKTIGNKDFEAWDQQHYSKEGFYKPGYNYSQGTSNVAFYGGLSYKIETQKWLLIPRILVGVISTYKEQYRTTYKLKNEHSFYEVNLQPKDEADGSAFSAQGGLTGYFRIRKLFSVSVGAMLHYQNEQYNYRYENKLVPSGEIYREEYEWDKPNISARLSAGVSFTFPGRKSKR